MIYCIDLVPHWGLLAWKFVQNRNDSLKFCANEIKVSHFLSLIFEYVKYVNVISYVKGDGRETARKIWFYVYDFPTC